MRVAAILSRMSVCVFVVSLTCSMGADAQVSDIKPDYVDTGDYFESSTLDLDQVVHALQTNPAAVVFIGGAAAKGKPPGRIWRYLLRSKAYIAERGILPARVRLAELAPTNQQTLQFWISKSDSSPWSSTVHSGPPTFRDFHAPFLVDSYSPHQDGN